MVVAVAVVSRFGNYESTSEQLITLLPAMAWFFSIPPPNYMIWKWKPTYLSLEYPNGVSLYYRDTGRTYVLFPLYNPCTSYSEVKLDTS